MSNKKQQGQKPKDCHNSRVLCCNARKINWLHLCVLSRPLQLFFYLHDIVWPAKFEPDSTFSTNDAAALPDWLHNPMCDIWWFLTLRTKGMGECLVANMLLYWFKFGFECPDFVPRLCLHGITDFCLLPYLHLSFLHLFFFIVIAVDCQCRLPLCAIITKVYPAPVTSWHAHILTKKHPRQCHCLFSTANVVHKSCRLNIKIHFTMEPIL